MPDVPSLRGLVADLLGRAVECDRTTLGPDAAPDALVATYETPDGAVGALVIADAAGAAALGAALTAMPTAIVETVRRAGTVDDPTIVENYGEIANVLSQVLNSPDTAHLRWQATHAADALDGAAAALLAAPAARRDLLVTVEGYGNGRLSVVVG